MDDESKQRPAGRRHGGADEHRGIDRDASRRPGVPRLREPRPWPNTVYPPERQRSDVTVFMHGRPHKTFPPVFGTAVPPRGLSGLVRKAAYRHPDHHMRHWTMLLLADRVDLWEHRVRRVLRVGTRALALGAVAIAIRALGARRPRARARRLGAHALARS